MVEDGRFVNAIEDLEKDSSSIHTIVTYFADEHILYPRITHIYSQYTISNIQAIMAWNVVYCGASGRVSTATDRLKRKRGYITAVI